MCRTPEPAFRQILDHVRELRFAAWLAGMVAAVPSARETPPAFDLNAVIADTSTEWIDVT
jgi:hypothetical protein